MMNKIQRNNPDNYSCRCGMIGDKWHPEIYKFKSLRNDGTRTLIVCKKCGKKTQLCDD